MRNFFKVVALVVVCNFAFTDFVKSQDLTKKFGEDSIACRSNISMYQEFYRQKNYTEAYAPWRAVVEDCPMSTKYIFAEGPVIIDGLLSEETDVAVREKYLNELFELFELRIKCYPADEGYTLGRMGVYTAKYRKDEYKKAYEYLDKSIDLSGKTSSPQVLDIYFKLAEVCMINEDLSTDFIMEAYDKVSGVMDLIIDDAELRLEDVMRKKYKLDEDLEQNVIDNEKFLADYEKLRKDSAQIANEFTQLKNVQNNMDLLFSKHAKCEMLIQIYGKKLETNKDERTLRQIIKFFNKIENCTDNDVYFDAVEELHKIRPEASTAYYMGKIYVDKKKLYAEALDYYKEAAEMYIKESEIINAYLMITDCYIRLKQYAAARETANKILRLNPNKGIAYILIGDAYMASASSCNTDIPGAVCWAAFDKYTKAKSVDNSIAEEVDKRLNTARAGFPKIEDYWGRGYEKGQSYKIECWINETTTIR